jgi:hypothetical protein
MPKPVADARTRIAEIAVEIAALREELRGIAESLSTQPDAADLAEETEDENSLLRSTIECILADSLEPAITNLERAAQRSLRRRAAKP